MDRKNLGKLIEEAMAIEVQSAKEAGTLGYMARAMVQATMPHKKITGNEFIRTNGAFTLSMLAPSSVGLPYGTIPRLLIMWLTTEAVRTKDRQLVLGRSLSEFMSQLDLVPTGGRWGTITRLRDQMNRLFKCYVSCSYNTQDRDAGENILIADRYDLWWSPKSPSQTMIWESTVTLNLDFFNEIITRPVPVDIRALKALRRSPMALDMYCWLTYRMSYLHKTVNIPWELLQLQFGAGYPLTPRGKADFKRKFLQHLRSVHLIYPSVHIETSDIGLLLAPSPTHVVKATHL
jgi:Plasmid encoded RepA protein